MNYSQKVKKILITNDTNKTVRRVVVETTLVDGDFTVSSTNDVALFLPDQNTFIPYDELTEEKVLEWTPIDEDMQRTLMNELEIKKSLPILDNFPWNNYG